jgi:hypothetical protein
MLEVTVDHLGAVQFEIRARQHTIVSDQPQESAGYDEGMTPPDFSWPRSPRAPDSTPPNISASSSWPLKARTSASPLTK